MRLFCSILVLCCFVVSCSPGNEPPSFHPINPNIIELKPSKPKFTGVFFMGVWRGNKIFTAQTFSIFCVDNNLKVISDTIITSDSYPYNWMYIDANEDGSKLLLVKSTYWDVSSGSLYEYDVNNGRFQLLRDSTHSISSARYLHGDDTKLIYYKYGDINNNGAGYYLLDKISNIDSLILSYVSPAGRSEMLNGFDIHPSNRKLLIPLIQSTRINLKPPKLCIYDFGKKVIDTMKIEFSFSWARTGLWVRYNKNADKILYSCFPHGSYIETTNDNSEVGIINLPSLTKRILDVNTNRNKNGSVQLAPNWSPDEEKIVYGSGDISYEGAVGRRRLYILKSLN